MGAYPGPPAGPPTGYAVPPESTSGGTWAWASGLLVLVCFPFVGSVLAGVLMVVVGLNVRGRGPLSAENGRRAANWGLTYTLLTVLGLGLHYGLLWYLTRDGSTITGFYPFGTIITIWALVTVLHLGVAILGTARAGSRRLGPAWGVPFFRARSGQGAGVTSG